MITSALLRLTFEKWVSRKSVQTPIGSMNVHSWAIRLHRSPSEKTFYIGLYAFDGAHPASGFCVARSFPMSFASAYRLVCSL